MRLSVFIAVAGLAVLAGPLPANGLDLDSSTVSALADLFEKGGRGHRDEERGAFLLAGGEESLGPCVLWPFTATRRATSFRGRIPAGATAIAHTHPNERPDPSSGDWQMAESLGMPVLVVTARGIRAAVPGAERPVVLLEGREWARKASNGARCGAL